jgi:glycosyltransferase involved in cell wall biosynthesis
MRIAMIGQKGIPATHGGPERHVEELAVRLAARGHDVIVYTRPNYADPALRTYKGVRLVSRPTVGTKHLDAITHTALCTAAALREKVDVFHYQAEGPALLCWVPRLAGKATVVTIHGQDWRRDKWGAAAKAVLRAGEWVSFKVPRATISVSESLADELEATYGRRAVFIPNGVSLSPESDDGVLEEFGLRKGRYVLFAARLVPEKGLHYLLDAWRRGFPGFKLAVAGGSVFSDDYVAAVQTDPPPDVIFTGWQHDARLASLFRNAALYVLPSDLEGLPIVLLEALGYGTPVLASDIAQNREVLGRYGATFRRGSVDDLEQRLLECLTGLPALKEGALDAQKMIAHEYDWEVVTDRTVDVYRSVIG